MARIAVVLVFVVAVRSTDEASFLQLDHIESINRVASTWKVRARYCRNVFEQKYFAKGREIRLGPGRRKRFIPAFRLV